MLESDDLVTSMLVFILIFISALLLAFFIINRRLSKSIWEPFNDSLEKLKSFGLTERSEISFRKSDIKEFEELNESLTEMIERIKEDYNRLRQFTENASHEIQTPLS